jgi:DNA-directed RNA polymerase subunit RPC12/RpoP
MSSSSQQFFCDKCGKPINQKEWHETHDEMCWCCGHRRRLKTYHLGCGPGDWIKFGGEYKNVSH